MMAKTYTAAHRVLVWLGKDSVEQNGKTTSEIIRHMSNLSEFDMVQAIMRSRSRDMDGRDHFYCVLSDLIFNDPNSSADASSDKVRAALTQIRRFFTRRYFRRLWVVQEMFTLRTVSCFVDSRRLHGKPSTGIRSIEESWYIGSAGRIPRTKSARCSV